MNVRWAKQIQKITNINQNELGQFDCLQLPVDAVMGQNESDFLKKRSTLLEQGFCLEVFESPLPAGIQVTEQGFNTYLWTEYLHTALPRIAELGCKTLIWSDGEARILPIEGDVARLKEQFYQFIYLLCDISQRYGITVCLEPLDKQRTNFLNSIKETIDCISSIGSSNLALTIGLRSLVELSIDSKELVTYKNHIAHIHAENPSEAGTILSPRADDSYDYVSFFKTVKDISYSGVISLPSDADKTVLLHCKKLCR